MKLNEIERLYVLQNVLESWSHFQDDNKKFLTIIRCLKHFHPYLDEDVFKNFISLLKNITPAQASRFFSKGQIESKEWITNELNNSQIKDLGTVYILGGWYGLLPNIMNKKYNGTVTRFWSFDLDDTVSTKADLFNNNFRVNNWFFKSVIKDMFSLNYKKDNFVVFDKNNFEETIQSQPDTIINTSCEHIDLKSWLELVPVGPLLILQSNNKFDEPEHISCHKTLVEFKEQLNLSKVLFSGKLKLPDYTRFMIIGYK